MPKDDASDDSVALGGQGLNQVCTHGDLSSAQAPAFATEDVGRTESEFGRLLHLALGASYTCIR